MNHAKVTNRLAKETICFIFIFFPTLGTLLPAELDAPF